MIWDLCKKTNEFLFIEFTSLWLVSKILLLPPSYMVTVGFSSMLGEHFEKAQPSVDPSPLQCPSGLQYSLHYLPLSIHVLQSVAVTSPFDCKVQVSGRISCIFFNSLGHTVRPGQYKSRPTADCHHGLPVLWEIGIWSLSGNHLYDEPSCHSHFKLRKG